MTTEPRAVAEAFSAHRFAETYDDLAPDVRWSLVGGPTIEGWDDVVATCEETMADLSGNATTTEFTRFVSVADERVAVVDAIARYTSADGEVTRVSSCDVYELRDGMVARITSYTVELDT